MDCDKLDVTFEDIAGMEGVKHSLQEVISEPLDLPPELYPVGSTLRTSVRRGIRSPFGESKTSVLGPVRLFLWQLEKRSLMTRAADDR